MPKIVINCVPSALSIPWTFLQAQSGIEVPLLMHMTFEIQLRWQKKSVQCVHMLTKRDVMTSAQTSTRLHSIDTEHSACGREKICWEIPLRGSISKFNVKVHYRTNEV